MTQTATERVAAWVKKYIEVKGDSDFIVSVGEQQLTVLDLMEVVALAATGAAAIVASAEWEERHLKTEKRVQELTAHGQADHKALHDALGWAGEFPRDLPKPWRAVTEIVGECDALKARVKELEIESEKRGAHLHAMIEGKRLWRVRAQELENVIRVFSPALLRAASLPFYAQTVELALSTPPVTYKRTPAPGEMHPTHEFGKECKACEAAVSDFVKER